jgi:hypothetical protein
MYIFYREQTPVLVERLSLLPGAFLHIQEFSINGYESGTICLSIDGFRRCFECYDRDVQSAVVSVPGAGIIHFLRLLMGSGAL